MKSACVGVLSIIEIVGVCKLTFIDCYISNSSGWNDHWT